MALEIVKAGADDAADIGLVHALSWRAAYGNIMPEAALNGVRRRYGLINSAKR